MATSPQPPCIPLKDDSGGKTYRDPYDASDVTAPLPPPPLPPSPGRGSVSFPALPPLVNRQMSTAGGSLREMEESPFSRQSSASRVTSIRHITPFKEEVSARGTGPQITIRTGPSTARSSSPTVTSPGSGRLPVGVAYSSPVSADELLGYWHPRSLRFQRGKVVGSGGFGTVYQAILSDGSLAAVKEMKLETGAKAIDREVRALSSLPPYQHCVRYLGSRHSSNHYYIIMEYISGGSIQSLRASVGRFNEAVMQRYAKMVLMGLQHLHKHGIIHRDIKGANVLLDERGSVKIVDFGCCKILSQPNSTLGCGGTPLWMAPEVCRGEPATAKSDVWGVGCLCLEMTNDTGVPWGFPASMNVQGIAYAIASAKHAPPIPKKLSPLAQNFIRCCLQIDVDDRLSVDELLEHQFFLQDFTGIDSADDDVIVSREESIDLYSSHSKIRLGRANNLDKSDNNNNNVKVIVSGTTSASSSRVNNNRRLQLIQHDGFRLEAASEDDDDDDDDDEDDDDIKDEGITNGAASHGTLQWMQSIDEFHEDEVIIGDHGLSTADVAMHSSNVDSSRPVRYQLTPPLQVHLQRQKAQEEQPQQEKSKPQQKFVRHLDSVVTTPLATAALAQPSPVSTRGSIDNHSHLALGTPPPRPPVPAVDPIVWESRGADSVCGVDQVNKTDELRRGQAPPARRMRQSKAEGGNVLKWFSK
ncbi:putative protein kinase [Trypanosoma grayi]|uniref:putative protein kinase n=1 Tax=Trypanosoma grayi TaxID=71804 RepID=UPI0004F4B00B|nr:putative protein kinase [Trypanosoma grayi]KEG07388.1 putative protein kinase [Trypanosoma grayi]